MMIRPAETPRYMELIPQAILAKPISYFQVVSAQRMNFSGKKVFAVDHDDLDLYEGATFQLDDGTMFAIRQYRGNPLNRSTVYLPWEIDDLNSITDIVSRVADEFYLGRADIVWQRSDNPD